MMTKIETMKKMGRCCECGNYIRSDEITTQLQSAHDKLKEMVEGAPKFKMNSSGQLENEHGRWEGIIYPEMRPDLIPDNIIQVALVELTPEEMEKNDE